MTDWRERAACAGLDVEIFFAPEGHRTIPFDTGPAMAVCARCPVRDACLADARAVGDRHGVRGGVDLTAPVPGSAPGHPRPCGSCRAPFTPKAANHLYCSVRCSRVEDDRRKRDRRRSRRHRGPISAA